MMAKAGAKSNPVAAKSVGNEDFIGLNPENKEEEEDVDVSEIEKLREENKRLKKTLTDKFISEAE